MQELVVKTPLENLKQTQRILEDLFDQCSVCFDYYYPKSPEGARPVCQDCLGK